MATYQFDRPLLATRQAGERLPCSPLVPPARARPANPRTTPRTKNGRVRHRRRGHSVDYSKLAASWQNGDREAGNALFGALGSELRRIAAARLRQERNCSLSAGDLVNEAILKLFRLNVMELQSRAHILAMSSRVMRQILIDEARKRATAKRQHASITLTTQAAQWEMPIDLMMIEGALHDLAQIDPQRAQIVEMRFFGGMSTVDIAAVLGVSEPTVKRRWASTRAWLRTRLGQS